MSLGCFPGIHVKRLPLCFGMRQIVTPYVHGPNQIGPVWHTEDLWMEEYLQH